MVSVVKQGKRRDACRLHLSVLVELRSSGQRRFAELMANPPSNSTEGMKRLAALPDFAERREFGGPH